MAKKSDYDAKSGVGGAATGAALGATLAAPTGGLSIGAGALLGALGGLGMGFLGEDEGPDIDISAELARIEALYGRAREQGTAAITQDFQAQRGELAQSQATRGILRSGVSQLGLARLGAARQQALASFEAQLSASQAGKSTDLLNALLGRKTALDTAAADRSRAGTSQLLAALSGAVGSYAGARNSAAAEAAAAGARGGGYNFAGSNMVRPPATSSSFYHGEYGTNLGLGGGRAPGYGSFNPGGGSGFWYGD